MPTLGEKLLKMSFSWIQILAVCREGERERDMEERREDEKRREERK